ncbi:MAG: response regulator transcription factor, partial [Oscillospiraceae bacterium]|nr:response regulator transcription factor [Oscillospiraceae bacterium]
ARVKVNIRRTELLTAHPTAPEGPGTGRLERGRVLIDSDTLMAYKDGSALDLTPKEFELLRFLAAEPEHIFSRETLMEKVWNYDGFMGDVRAVDVAVRRLREKLEDDPANPAFIITRRGLGYLFRAE